MTHALIIRHSLRFVGGMLLAATLVGGPAMAQGIRAHGVDIVPWSKKIGEGRFRSGRTFDKTVKFFRDNFRGSRRVKWHGEVNLPRVKYKHLQNLSAKRKWDGVNIYEIKNKVYIYVLPHAPEAKAGVEKKGKATQRFETEAALESFFAQAKPADLAELALLLPVDSTAR